MTLSSIPSGKQRGGCVAIIGAGAAGLMAAVFAARGGVRTLLLERTHGGGKKILISGGGRCNILPATLDERRFVTDSSFNSMRKMLRGWPLAAQRRFFEEDLDLPLVEEEGTAKLFPVTQRARDVYERLREAGRRAGVEFQGNSFVEELRPVAGGWDVQLSEGPALRCDRVIVATGGCSIPKTGSDGSGFAFARACDIPPALGCVVTPPEVSPSRARAISRCIPSIPR
ncbi:MAG: NAD(P)/FAD-dependent oxidoreductase [Bacteroidota bacterium]|nr:NAD(P)/FAD-dependent oxidoreductase [Bacteroidota bacterium]